MTAANLSYRTSSSRTSSGVGLVILLYEQLVQDLRRAAAAIDGIDIEARTFELGHALEVVGNLQARLDMQAGGRVAQNLDRFYAALQAGILEAQTAVSKPLLMRLIENVLSVREAWLDVERLNTLRSATAEHATVHKPETQAGTSASARNWKA
jgi:flagellar protein FliS